MQLSRVKNERRGRGRIRGVLPVRVRGKNAAGAEFEGLAHTLDFAPGGARLGAIRQELKALDKLTILFRQRRMEFTVMWTKRLGAGGEYQVGLKMAQSEGNGTNFFASQVTASVVFRAAV